MWTCVGFMGLGGFIVVLHGIRGSLRLWAVKPERVGARGARGAPGPAQVTDIAESGNAERPVTVPFPLIVTAIIYLRPSMFLLKFIIYIFTL